MNMELFRHAICALSIAAIAGCTTQASSTAVAPGSTPWQGPVLVTQSSLPAGIEYTIVGSVRAEANGGYDQVITLYPLLADEARKLGANAVINAAGGRKVSLFSWAAPYVAGLAIKVEDTRLLKGVPGTYY